MHSLVLDEPPRVASTQPPLGKESNHLGRTRDLINNVLEHQYTGSSLDVAGDTTVYLSCELRHCQLHHEDFERHTYLENDTGVEVLEADIGPYAVLDERSVPHRMHCPICLPRCRKGGEGTSQWRGKSGPCDIATAH